MLAFAGTGSMKTIPIYRYELYIYIYIYVLESRGGALRRPLEFYADQSRKSMSFKIFAALRTAFSAIG